MMKVIQMNSHFDKLKLYHSFEPEVLLRKAIIMQALSDMVSVSKKPCEIMDSREAKRWLLGNSDDFKRICIEAGLTPSYVKKIAQEMLDLRDGRLLGKKGNKSSITYKGKTQSYEFSENRQYKSAVTTKNKIRNSG